MNLSLEQRRKKLKDVAFDEGYGSVIELLHAIAGNERLPGICTTWECDFTVAVRRDEFEGWCDLCNRPTVASILILAGVVQERGVGSLGAGSSLGWV